MSGDVYRKRGRPLGFRLSEYSKQSIKKSKEGQRHSEETKDKISKSLILYFKRLNPLSNELFDKYSIYDVGNEIYDWIGDVYEDINNSDDILTQRIIKNKNKVEISCGDNIELFSHNITPELILLFKEYCEENDIDPDEVM